MGFNSAFKGLKLNETLEIMFCANDTDLLEENKHTVCEGNEREALLVLSNKVSLVANAERKQEKFTTQKWVNKYFESLNVWE